MYGKLFASCFTGSMSGSGAEMFAVWAYILANSGVDGDVELNPALIGAMIGMPKENVVSVINKLCQPDPNSRSKEQDGKRLIKSGEFLYEIVNYQFYREMQNKKNQRDYMRKYMQNKRKNLMLNNVKNVSTQVEADVEVKVEENNTYIHTSPKNTQNQTERIKEIKNQCNQILKTTE